MKKLLSRTIPESISDLGSDLNPVLQRIYAARGVRSAEELECTLNQLLPVNDLLNIEQSSGGDHRCYQS